MAMLLHIIIAKDVQAVSHLPRLGTLMMPAPLPPLSNAVQVPRRGHPGPPAGAPAGGGGQRRRHRQPAVRGWRLWARLKRRCRGLVACVRQWVGDSGRCYMVVRFMLAAGVLAWQGTGTCSGSSQPAIKLLLLALQAAAGAPLELRHHRPAAGGAGRSHAGVREQPYTRAKLRCKPGQLEGCELLASAPPNTQLQGLSASLHWSAFCCDGRHHSTETWHAFPCAGRLYL